MWIIKKTFVFLSYSLMFHSFAAISTEEVHSRLKERFGGNVFQQAFLGQFIKEDAVEEPELQEIIATIEANYCNELILFYTEHTLPLLASKEWIMEFERIQSLPESLEKMSLLFAVYKTLKLQQHFCSLKHSNYNHKQLQLIRQRLEDLQMMKQLEHYPHPERYNYVKFLGRTVFKAKLDRAKEIGCYELACMLDLDRVIAPSHYGFFSGKKGIFQSYIPISIESSRQFWFSTYRWVQFQDYIHCAMSVLLFAMEDMHAGNMYFISKDNGYFQAGFFDSVGSFTYANFHLFDGKGTPVLFTPFAWIGFDFPQYRYPFQEKEKKMLTNWLNHWKKFRMDIEKYLESGLCEMYLEKHEKVHFLQRLDLMSNILSKETSSIQQIHEAFVPEYKIVKTKLAEFFPYQPTMFFLFQLLWNPDRALAKCSQERRQEFLEWISCFLQQLERSKDSVEVQSLSDHHPL